MNMHEYYKIIIHYDNDNVYGCIIEEIIYCIQNNATDYYRHFLDENGKFIECFGTDSFCDYLGHALRLETYIDQTSNNNEWWGCKVEEIGFDKLPEIIKEKYDKG